MRLRLDKLVLSAGLALAIVATTIPVGAGTTTSFTPGLTKISTDSVVANPLADKDFRTAVFAKTAQETPKTISSTVTRKTAVTDNNGLTINKVAVATPSQKTTNYAKSQNVDLVGENINITEGTITVTETFTLSEYIYTSAAISQESTNDNKIDNQNAANDYVNGVIVKKVTDKVLADNSITIDDEANPVVTLETGTAAAAAIVDTDKVPSKIKYTEAVANPASPAKVTVDANTQFRVSGDIVVKSVYTVDTLPSDYAFDVAFDTTLDAGKEYSVIKEYQDADGNYCAETVESSVIDGKVTFRTTDVTSKYYLAAKTVSSSKTLLFGDDGTAADAATQEIAVSDTLTLTVKSVAAPDDTAEFDTVAKANNAKIAGYFTANLSGGLNYTDSEVTVKIVKPKDIEALAGEGKTIKYTVIRQHTGMPIEALETNSDGEYITFSSKYFSTYALAYEIVDAAETPAEDPTEDPTTAAPANEDTQAPATTPEAAQGTGGTTSKTSSSGTADNSMMPLFMTTLLLALCAGSLAIYKEKKTN